METSEVEEFILVLDQEVIPNLDLTKLIKNLFGKKNKSF